MRLLTVSRLCTSDSYKNIDLVIEAVKQLDFCTLTIVGDGDDKIRLQQLAGACPRIDFRGHVDEAVKHQLYEACDVFVLPSTKEGFGLVFLEAMQHGKPCIGAMAGATQELIEHNVTGVLIAGSNLHFLLEVLRWMSAYQGECWRMGQNGKRRSQEYFSYDRFKSRVKELLR